MGFSRSFSAVVLAMVFGGAAVVHAALPAITGDLAGKFKLNALKGAAPVAWKLHGEPTPDGGAKAELIATAPGLELEIEGTLPGDGGAGTWHVRKGRLDAAVWAKIDALRDGIKQLPPDLAVTGVMQLEGHGTWAGGAAISGEMTAKLEGGEASSVAQGWEIKGISYEAVLSLLPENYKLKKATFRAATMTAGGLEARNLHVEAEGDTSLVSVKQVEIETLDGAVSLDPFVVDLADPRVKTSAQLSHVAMEHLNQYLPAALSEAKGSVGGTLAIDWSLRLGLQAAGGALVVADDAPSSIKLAPSPGFLTGNMPKRFEVLPAWTGPFVKWLSFENPAYDPLQKVELGQVGLQVESLTVQLYPDGPHAPRSVYIDVKAHPTDQTLIKSVHFEVNVLGPIDTILKLGTDQRAKIKASVKMGK